MVQYSDVQKKIALALLGKPQTVESLVLQLKLPHGELSEELAKLIKLGVVKKEGFPTQYKLLDAVMKGVQELKTKESTDDFWVRIRVTIEARSIEETLLKKELERVEKLLHEEPGFTVYQSSIQPIERVGEHYSSYVEASLGVQNFKALMKLMFYYGPVSLEVIKPSNLQLNAHELQEGLLDASQMIQMYTDYIAKNMSQHELAKFYHELYTPNK